MALIDLQNISKQYDTKVILKDAKQLFPSITLTVYIPADKELACATLPPEGVQL